MSPADFDDAMQRGEMRLAFIGMSNAGKTTAARALERACGFRHREVDAAIERELELADMGAMAAWLGYPEGENFEERQRQYLASEEKYTTVDPDSGNVVLDTTGSFVHLSDAAKEKIRNQYLVVHFDVGEEETKNLIERFFAVPKPVVWGDFFEPLKGESIEETLSRCYPSLLQERLKIFRTLSHINLPAQDINFKNGPQILDRIRTVL